MRRHVTTGVGNRTSVNFTALCVGPEWLVKGKESDQKANFVEKQLKMNTTFRL